MAEPDAPSELYLILVEVGKVTACMMLLSGIFFSVYYRTIDIHASNESLRITNTTNETVELTREAMCRILCEKGVVHHHQFKQTRLNKCVP